MSRVVHKFQLRKPNVSGMSTVEIPDDHVIVHVAMQGGIPTLWAEVNPEAPKVRVHYRIFGTGHQIPDKGFTHVGTLFEGPFVWHVYRAYDLARDERGI